MNGKTSSTFEVVDLTAPRGFGLEPKGTVDVDVLAQQLKEISAKIAPVLIEEEQSAFGLDTVEVALTVGAEGGVLFVAKGSAEASIRLTFSRR